MRCSVLLQFYFTQNLSHRYAWHKMRPIVTDVPWSVCLSVALSLSSSQKTAQAIEMPFGVWTRGDPWNHALLGTRISPERCGLRGSLGCIDSTAASHLWCGNFTGYQSGKGSDLRQQFWSSSASMDWLQNMSEYCKSTTGRSHLRPANACLLSLFRAHGQPTVTGVLLSVDQSRGTVYLWHCVQVTSRRRLSEDIWRHFCLTVMTI